MDQAIIDSLTRDLVDAHHSHETANRDIAKRVMAVIDKLGFGSHVRWYCRSEEQSERLEVKALPPASEPEPEPEPKPKTRKRRRRAINLLADVKPLLDESKFKGRRSQEIARLAKKHGCSRTMVYTYLKMAREEADPEAVVVKPRRQPTPTSALVEKRKEWVKLVTPLLDMPTKPRASAVRRIAKKQGCGERSVYLQLEKLREAKEFSIKEVERPVTQTGEIGNPTELTSELRPTQVPSYKKPECPSYSTCTDYSIEQKWKIGFSCKNCHGPGRSQEKKR